MNPTEIEFAVKDLVAKPCDPAMFPFDLIGIYNASKVTVSRLKNGQTNAAKQSGDVLWKKHLFFRPARPGDDVGEIGDALAADPLTTKHKPRFILVTNGEYIHARDLQLDDTLNVEYSRLDESSNFLLPLAGYERRAVVEEHPADIKAAKKLKKLYDALLAANPTWATGHHSHELNLLMTRLLFCFYAEKTGIFETAKIFTNTVTQYTSENGTDVAPLLDRLFRIMNVEEKQRPKNTSTADANFPYVNGSLFEDTVEIPQFNQTARRQMLECGDLDWTTINPDIFGSMIQTVAQDGTRSNLGMHYTSRPNILKVLQPLFLDDLNEAYEKAKDSVPKLEALLGRLGRLRVFDPACGSGNFLIIAYKEMRALEIRTIQRIGEISPSSPLRLSGISIQHFFGIDIADFACETAKLSLWIAEHQTNSTFKDVFGTARPTLPLSKIVTIVRLNAATCDWASVCPQKESFETYICGNPPYVGTSMQTNDQKEDVEIALVDMPKANANLDYIACWFNKGHSYLANALGPTRLAFVSTNSICQGEHVPMLWPTLLSKDIEIDFAHASFKWANNASNNAGVSCVIIGLSKKPDAPQMKQLFIGDTMMQARCISPYLLPFATPVVYKRTEPLSELPLMLLGSQPSDGGNLLFSPEERAELLRSNPEVKPCLKKYMGSQEFVKGIERWCLWVTNDDVAKRLSGIPDIKRRFDLISGLREKGGTRGYSYRNAPHKFVLVSHKEGQALIIPTVTSETRQYLTIGAIDGSYVVSNLAYAVYDPPEYLLSLLSSRMHVLWATTVGGHLETRMRYSNQYIYNTFPVPKLSEEQKRALADYSKAILKARSMHPGKTVAALYNPETMPANLLEAHKMNDAYLEEFIYGRTFQDDTQRLERLFGMYSNLINANISTGSLFVQHTEAGT